MTLQAISPRFAIKIRLILPQEIICWSKVFRGSFSTAADWRECIALSSEVDLVGRLCWKYYVARGNRSN